MNILHYTALYLIPKHSYCDELLLMVVLAHSIKRLRETEGARSYHVAPSSHSYTKWAASDKGCQLP